MRTVVGILKEGLHRLLRKVVWHNDAVCGAVRPGGVAAGAHVVAPLAQHSPAACVIRGGGGRVDVNQR